MKKHLLTLVGLALVVLPVLLQACTGGETPQAETPETEPVAESSENQAAGETDTLQIRVNGEDFVRRQGFVSKDGWETGFDRLYGNLADLTAYQTDSPYAPEAGTELQASQEVKVEEVKTILEQNLSGEGYNELLEILPSLGHVGEGHCEETRLTT
jgi:hypothetical protein